MNEPSQTTSVLGGQKSIFDLTGKKALVTGAGRGIGRAIAVGLARHGADVAVISRNAEEVQETAEMVRREARRGLGLTCDVSDAVQISKTMVTVLDQFETIDILVNNAGITKRKPTIEFSQEDFSQIVATNLAGAFYCCQAVGKVMLQQRQGSIINVGALAGIMGLGRGNAVYTATKGALFAMTRDLACEWGPHGIRVNALAPHWIRTKMIASLMENEPFMKRILSRVPLGRIGEPEELVGSVVFLASDASALITGQVLALDGGVSTTFMAPEEPTR